MKMIWKAIVFLCSFTDFVHHAFKKRGMVSQKIMKVTNDCKNNCLFGFCIKTVCSVAVPRVDCDAKTCKAFILKQS